ncbi:MAG TPA: AAA family ATPase, partial [Longimicrobiaceae bacterium]|nr:AAA family ATPase [Longimicrobiaceae bacterium]
EVMQAMRALTRVHYQWGTAQAWNEGGLAALFCGPPGTGKTMAAEVLAAACRAQAHLGLGAVATRVETRHGWDDLVLPADALCQLREMCSQVRHRDQVFERWGFGRKAARGRGTSALFTGPPGTGKTMAAEVVAADLQLDLYKVDLARVVSKWIGETEKNLSRIFDEAEDGNAILFFDEADALFGKRTEVSDAHDRYANVETSYLLQRMEEYGGVVILASNLRENMDDAFVRRLRFVVEFPFPDAASRLRIWKTHFPAEAPVGGDVDCELLAERVQVAGGNIRNIVLAAAFFAADDGGVLRMEHLAQGTRREYEKIGKLWEGQALAPRGAR